MNGPVNQNPWVVIPRPNPSAKLRLFCLPFAGGSSANFRSWANLLPETIELAAIEIPGRGQRLSEALVHQLPDLVQGIAGGIEPYLDKPFVLFGHSMGAVVGFELATMLTEKYQKTPVHVFLSGRGAPTLPSREQPIHQLPEDEFISEIKKYNGTPREVLEHEELMQLMIPIIRADFEVCETYSYSDGKQLTVPLTVFGGLQDYSASQDELKAWKNLTANDFNLRMFPGDHFFILNNVALLLQSIARDINAHFNISRAS